MASGVNVYLYGCVNLLATVCLCTCVISNQNNSKKTHMSDPSKLDTLSHKTHSKVLLVLRYKGLICHISLRKITHQKWRNLSFIQRNKATGWWFGGGLDKILKMEGR